MRRAILALVVVTVILAGIALWRHHQPVPLYEIAYAREDQVSVWSSTAEVRGVVATLKFGDRVDVIQREHDNVQVRTKGGVTGWVDENDLIPGEVWQRGRELVSEAGDMPVQAFGKTRVRSNLHTSAGRETPVLVQLDADAPVQMLRRQLVEFSGPAQTSALNSHADMEEWWMIRTEVKGIGPVAGWVLGRFLVLSAPDPLPDYANSSAMHLIAWFTLNRVPDGDGGEKPQYLAAGLKEGESSDCDFNMLRVYTWGTKRQRYETAFAESNVCGKLPIAVTPATTVGGDSEFRFASAGPGVNEEYVYQMRQTLVRRIRGESMQAGGARKGSGRRASQRGR